MCNCKKQQIMQSSIFNLKTDVSELASANLGISKSTYMLVPPSRDCTLNNFSNGSIYFNWDLASSKWMIPSKSYLRIRCSLTRGNLAQLTTEDGVAPNMNLCSNLFQNCEWRIGDKTVSRVTDFMAQIDSLENRQLKSKSWLESIGKTVTLMSADFSERLSDVAVDATLANTYENSLSRVQLGYLAAHTLSVTANTGVLVFTDGGAGGLPDAATIWEADDEIEIVTGVAAVGNLRYRVSAVRAADQLQLNNVAQVALADGAYPFRRIRKSMSEEDARKKLNIELCWQPPLSIFKVPHALPTGRYTLVLNPSTQSAIQKMAVETKLGAGNRDPGNTATTYKFQVVDMFLYLATVDGARADNLSYLLDLSSTRCQTDKIDSTSFGQKNFDISPSTTAVTIAYADLRAGNDSQISQSKFRSYNAAVTVPQELNLTRFFFQYGGVQYPSPDVDAVFNTGTDYFTQRYLETQLATGSFMDTGGTEDYATWKERGMYMTYLTPRDGSDRSTRILVNSQFATGTDITNMRILCFDHFRSVARIRIQDGQVVQVDVEDI